MRFWAFQCSFLINNNFSMAEVFVGGTRKELLAAMTKFFRAPRSNVLVADVLGAWLVEDGAAASFSSAKPFVSVAIAKQQLSFEQAAEALAGDLDGAISRVYLAKGKADAVDATEEDEEDDDEAELKPFKFVFDAAGFLAQLPEVDGAKLPLEQRVLLVRPLGAPGYSGSDEARYHPNVEVTPGWSDAEKDATPMSFDPKTRFVRDLSVPTI
jgi:hypothetical protein